MAVERAKAAAVTTMEVVARERAEVATAVAAKGTVAAEMAVAARVEVMAEVAMGVAVRGVARAQGRRPRRFSELAAAARSSAFRRASIQVSKTGNQEHGNSTPRSSSPGHSAISLPK